MRSDDLVPLVTAPAGASTPVGYRQGVVVSWNRADATGTVLVGGTLMENLPCQSVTEASLLVPGDVVGILTAGATWAILGRFIRAGSPEAAQALAALQTQSATELNTSSITSISWAAAPTNPGPEVTIRVGPSGRLLVLLSAEFVAQAAIAAGNTMSIGGYMGFTLSGANTLAAGTDRALLMSHNLLANSSAITLGIDSAGTRAVLVTGLNPGLTTVTAVYMKVVGAAASVTVDDRNLTVMAI